MKTRKLMLVLIVLQLAGMQVQASAMDDLNAALMKFAAALALVMLTIQGLKWLMSQSPAERAETKKGMIYIIVGLIAVYIAANMVCGIYGSVIEKYDTSISCSFDPATLTCTC